MGSPAIRCAQLVIAIRTLVSWVGMGTREADRRPGVTGEKLEDDGKVG